MPDNRNAWDKQNTVPVMIKLNKNTDADIIAVLMSKDNRQAYIKELIRQDIRK